MIFKKHGTGALEDPRSIEEKLKDYRLEELVTSIRPVEWREKPQEEWKQYLPIRNQDGAGSCVAHSKALELGILNKLEEGEFVTLSARDVYTRRANQGSPGMWGQDANTICLNHGSTLELLMPSDNKNEQQINTIADRLPHKEMVGMIFRAKNWIALPYNIDAIAAILDTGVGVNLFFRFAYSEWTAVPKITQVIPDCHHSVVAIDYTLYQGKKALIIQDSWGSIGFGGRRVITEDWINPANRRISWASYFEDLCNWDLLKKEGLKKPKANFNRDLYYGLWNDPDVARLQDCLKFLNLFPKTQESTGNFFGITRASVKAFQELHGIEPVLGYFGPITRAKMNSLF